MMCWQSVLIRLGNKDFYDGKKLVTSGLRRKAPAPPANLQLQNSFGSLCAGEGLGALSDEASEAAEPEKEG